MIKRLSRSARRAGLMAILCFSATAMAGAAFWPAGARWGDSTRGRVAARVAPAFGFTGTPPPPPPPPTATATKTASLSPSAFDADADGKADPGDKIRYTITVADATA